MCPHTTNANGCTTRTSSEGQTGVLILLNIYASAYCYICLLYMCPHTPNMSPTCARWDRQACPHATIYESSFCYICANILLHMCPRTTIYVSAYVLILCVLVLQHIQRPHATTYLASSCMLYVSSYYYTCTLMLLCFSSY